MSKIDYGLRRRKLTLPPPALHRHWSGGINASGYHIHHMLKFCLPSRTCNIRQRLRKESWIIFLDSSLNVGSPLF